MRRALRWLFEDRTTGRIVVVQWPNIPLWAWIASGAARRLVPRGWEAAIGGLHADARGAIAAVGTVALLVWAALEVTRGVNPFRRGLGGVVLASILLAAV